MLHRALRDAVKWGVIPRNVAEDAVPPRAGRPRLNVWTPEQLGDFVDHVRDDRFSALWLLVATTGLRRGELAGLTRDDIDILTLTKGLVDGIDSSPLKAFLGGAEAGEQSLRLLDRFVQKIGGSADCVEPFRALQKFRSTGGIAHLGGSSAEAARSRLGIEGLAPFPTFVVVVEQLTVALERITELVEGVANEAK